MAFIKKFQKVLSASKSLNIFDQTSLSTLKNLKEYFYLKDAKFQVLEAIQLEDNIGKQTDVLSDTFESNLKCTTCNVRFLNIDGLRDHNRLDWHRYNAKQKILLRPLLNEDEFDLHISGELSSISGSDTESEEDIAPTSQQNSIANDELPISTVTPNSFFIKHPYKRFFINDKDQLISVYRNVSETAFPDHCSINKGVWIYLMLSAGHFAGVVYEKKNIITHKTFHRYTIRAKRGGAQGIHDKKQGGAKSAGASIRRYNEAALAQEIQELILSWKAHFKNAEKIFYRCAPHNFHILFDQKDVITKDDARCTKISVNSRRPTLKEVKRIHELFSTVDVHGLVSDIETTIEGLLPSQHPVEKNDLQLDKPLKKSNRELCEPVLTEKSSLNTKKKETKKRQDELNKKVDAKNDAPKKGETELSLLWKLLYSWCEKVEFEKLQNFFTTNFNTMQENSGQKLNEACNNDSMLDGLQHEQHVQKSTIKEFLENDSLNYCSCETGETLLHASSRCSSKEIVSLLMSYGCNPSVRDVSGRKPYDVAVVKDVRNEFRRFMAKYPDKYDYKSANIPSPLTEEQEAEQQQKTADKKKAQIKAKKERQKLKKAEERHQKLAEKEQKVFESLSDREKRAAMAERRLATQLNASLRCANCRSPINETQAFERFEYKYCSTACVHAHKTIIGK